MRLNNYKLLNEMCGSFKEAVKYTSETGDKSVLKTCAELLSAINTNLEANRKSLRSEKVFEIIFNLSKEIIDIMNNEYTGFENVIKLSDDLSNMLSNDINYKLRILFVAELGGKWDSMASVYEEFMKRDDCDVDVVLQPIFRAVNYSDGTTKNDIIYEDYLTPMGIKNIPYDKYDMEKIKPDITFFSQPYESVTLPMFWPENMAKHTRVVYLPYFFSKGIGGAGYSSFFLSETQKYAWRIVCQSEQLKKLYGTFASRKGENVISTGIPKLDYPLKLNKENTPCPKEWKKKINNRKTFLWSTHFSKASEGDEPFSYVKEMIDLFINKPDIALIWRAHPMTETIIKLYTPNLYPLYQQIINRIERSDNIIIDKYEKYDNSIVWTDALISDGSSLDAQYMLTGKPVVKYNSMTREKYLEAVYQIPKMWDFTREPIIFTIDELKEFIENICNGYDPTAEDRKFLMEEYLGMAGGNIGKRVAEKIIYDFKIENGLPAAGENAETNGCLLIVGSEEDSMPCIKRLEELNVNYRVCNDYIENKPYSTDVPLCSVNELCNDNSFENVIVTERKYTSAVVKQLTEIYNIPKNRIMNFWSAYNASLPLMHCDRVMMNPKTEKYEGLILGISHTEVGIIADDLKKPFVNLALSSQDLYYQLKVLEYCAYKYPQKLNGLKYAVIDLYDYKYFNFDTSKSKSAIKYLGFGGYNMDPHNFAQNKNFDCTYEEAVNAVITLRYQNLSNNDIEVWNKYFKDEIYKHADYKGFEPNYPIKDRIHTVTDADVQEYVKPAGNLGVNVFEQTIKENIQNLESIFKTLLKVNKDMKIYTIIVPKFVKTEMEIKDRVQRFVPLFDETMKYMHEKYNFTMLDFSKISDISIEKEFYYDAAHLNYFGAKWLTDKLNEIMFGDVS